MKVESVTACNRSNCQTLGLWDTGTQEKRLFEKQIRRSLLLWDSGTEQKEKAMKVELVPACDRSNCQIIGLLDTGTQEKMLCQKQIRRSLLLWDTGTDQKDKTMKVALVPACNRSNCWTTGLLDTGTQEKRLCQKQSSQSMFLWDTGTDQKEKTMKVVLVPACDRSKCQTKGWQDTGTDQKDKAMKLVLVPACNISN